MASVHAEVWLKARGQIPILVADIYADKLVGVRTKCAEGELVADMRTLVAELKLGAQVGRGPAAVVGQPVLQLDLRAEPVIRVENWVGGILTHIFNHVKAQ